MSTDGSKGCVSSNNTGRKHSRCDGKISYSEWRQHSRGLMVAVISETCCRCLSMLSDARCYDYVLVLRAIDTIDFMTARWAHLPYEFLDHCSRRIINEIPRIARVVYDIAGKPPGTIVWE